MILIFGGAYQGKLDFAESEFDIDRVCDCREVENPDFTADCICNVDRFVMRCTKNGVEAKEYFRERSAQWRDTIIIMNDVSQGVVPIDKDVRAFREMNGRLMVYLAGEADRVIRVFCGIGMDVKQAEQEKK